MRTWSLVTAVVVVAASAWGLYAWKVGDDPTNEDVTLAASSDDHESGLTSLRATRPTEHKKPPANLSFCARANMPASVEDVTDDAGWTVLPPAEERSEPDRTEPEAAAPAPTPASERERPLQIEEPEVDHSLARSDAAAGWRAIQQGRQVEARELLTRAMQGDLPEEEADTIRAELARLSNVLVFSRTVVPNDTASGTHIVSSGESLYVIAQRHHITGTILAQINGIEDPSRLRAGARIKVLNGPFHATIYKSKHRMDIYLDDVYVRSFRVGLGTNGGTPLGEWVVTTKLMDPDWTDPTNGEYYPSGDPENPIGERWIGLHCNEGECLGRTGFGIHGTIEPESIGENMSMGCVRLAPDDIAMVFDLLVRGESQVEILP